LLLLLAPQLKSSSYFLIIAIAFDKMTEWLLLIKWQNDNSYFLIITIAFDKMTEW